MSSEQSKCSLSTAALGIPEGWQVEFCSSPRLQTAHFPSCVCSFPFLLSKCSSLISGFHVKTWTWKKSSNCYPLGWLCFLRVLQMFSLILPSPKLNFQLMFKEATVENKNFLPAGLKSGILVCLQLFSIFIKGIKELENLHTQSSGRGFWFEEAAVTSWWWDGDRETQPGISSVPWSPSTGQSPN